jgi:hypothetical protein
VTDRGEWEDLQVSIQKVLSDGRLGKPAFARAFAQAAGGPQEARAALTAMTAMANTWFGAEAEVVHLAGGEESGHLVSLLRWPGGQSAVLSVGPGGPGPKRLDLALLGSRGAVYYRTPEGVGGASA